MVRRGMGQLRLDRDWIGLGEGHGTVALRLLIRFWGTREHRDVPITHTKGGTERQAHRFVPPPRWLRNLADLGAFPRTVGQMGQNGAGGRLLHLGQYPPDPPDPQPRLTRMGNCGDGCLGAWGFGELSKSIM